LQRFRELCVEGLHPPAQLSRVDRLLVLGALQDALKKNILIKNCKSEHFKTVFFVKIGAKFSVCG
jgi:hypothetical protein